MIKELIITLLPSFSIMLIIFIIVQLFTDVRKRTLFNGFSIGMLSIIPSMISMKLIGLLITITYGTLPLLIYQIISVTNEEAFKLFGIKNCRNKEYPILRAMFVGGGFAMCETVALHLGIQEVAFLRSFTTLPLHILTAIVLSKTSKSKLYFALAVSIHLLYNKALIVMF